MEAECVYCAVRTGSLCKIRVTGAQTFVKLISYFVDTTSGAELPCILESNPHPFYSFRGLKNQMRIRITCGLDSRPRAGFWKNDRAAERAVRTIQ